jgi:predicted alpha/beta-hydrolase family hydrolase
VAGTVGIRPIASVSGCWQRNRGRARQPSIAADEPGETQHLCYPFHPPGKPLQLRTEHLVALQTPTLLLQGERDPFGRREEVEGYHLSSAVELHWLLSGDHSFNPTRSSGLTEAENWAAAVTCSDRFLRSRVGD